MSRGAQLTLAEGTIAVTVAAIALMVLVLALAHFGLKRGLRQPRSRPRTRVPVQGGMSGMFLVELEPAHNGMRWHWLVFEDAPMLSPEQLLPYAVGCSETRHGARLDAKRAITQVIDWDTFTGPVSYRFTEVTR